MRPLRRGLLVVSLALACLLLQAGPWPAHAGDPWAALREEAVGLMRHGGAVVATPGQAAPLPGCFPNAVLTPDGREEMRRFGERLRAEGVTAARILSSRQCSAWETAHLLGLGPVEHEPALDPWTPADREARRAALERSLALAAAERDSSRVPVILITHRLNISELTGIELQQGEVLLLRSHSPGLRLVGRITSD